MASLRAAPQPQLARGRAAARWARLEKENNENYIFYVYFLALYFFGGPKSCCSSALRPRLPANAACGAVGMPFNAFYTSREALHTSVAVAAAS